uniref:Protein kinase domain-containing protein n=1 Tax=Compsopogon caeruleus TaxID=31354 RepID=A0A7S1XDT0_9RHOD|mmetsp:Transcript_15513/g.31387  ORF Transcript_15513/g.31387 Transcript_15513/m.31387 type:complete len:810 (+) Transcript_15513:59-2488(+)
MRRPRGVSEHHGGGGGGDFGPGGVPVSISWSRLECRGQETFGRLDGVQDVSLRWIRLESVNASLQDLVSLWAVESKLPASVVLGWSWSPEQRAWVLVLEYIEGRSLRDVLMQIRRMGLTWDPNSCLDVVSRLAGTIQQFHEACLPHGRLSPCTVFLSGSPKPVQGTSLAWIPPFAQVKLGPIPHYMDPVTHLESGMEGRAPETLFELRGLGLETLKQADLFSLGTILWEISHLKIPWGENSYATVVEHLLAGERPSWDESRGTLEPLKTIGSACWKMEPSSRPHVGAVLVDLALARRAQYSCDEDIVDEAATPFPENRGVYPSAPPRVFFSHRCESTGGAGGAPVPFQSTQQNESLAVPDSYNLHDKAASLSLSERTESETGFILDRKSMSSPPEHHLVGVSSIPTIREQLVPTNSVERFPAPQPHGVLPAERRWSVPEPHSVSENSSVTSSLSSETRMSLRQDMHEQQVQASASHGLSEWQAVLLALNSTADEEGFRAHCCALRIIVQDAQKPMIEIIASNGISTAMEKALNLFASSLDIQENSLQTLSILSSVAPQHVGRESTIKSVLSALDRSSIPSRSCLYACKYLHGLCSNLTGACEKVGNLGGIESLITTFAQAKSCGDTLIRTAIILKRICDTSPRLSARVISLGGVEKLTDMMLTRGKDVEGLDRNLVSLLGTLACDTAQGRAMSRQSTFGALLTVFCRHHRNPSIQAICLWTVLRMLREDPYSHRIASHCTFPAAIRSLPNLRISNLLHNLAKDVERRVSRGQPRTFPINSHIHLTSIQVQSVIDSQVAESVRRRSRRDQ